MPDKQAVAEEPPSLVEVLEEDLCRISCKIVGMADLQYGRPGRSLFEEMLPSAEVEVVVVVALEGEAAEEVELRTSLSHNGCRIFYQVCLEIHTKDMLKAAYSVEVVEVGVAVILRGHPATVFVLRAEFLALTS